MSDETVGSETPRFGTEPASAEAGIRATLDEFWSGWERLDIEAVLATLIADNSLTFIGTDGDEYWQGYPAVVEPLHAMARAFAEERVAWFHGDPRVDIAGDVAWASGRLRTVVVFRDGSSAETDIRATLVVRRVDKTWRITQAHISVAPVAPVAVY